MSKELVVSSTPHQTRLALLEDDRLVEIYVERESHQGLAGSIHKGRVTRVLPGMQSAFVDIGLDRDAFLYVSDFFEGLDEYEGSAGDTKEEGSVGPEVEPPAEQESLAGRTRRRGRRGRRGRSGRQRESGIPEAKYTKVEDDGGTAPSDEPAVGEEVETAAPEPVVGFDGDFAILPGESLAKYTGEDSGDHDRSVAEREPETSLDDAPSEAEESVATPVPVAGADEAALDIESKVDPEPPAEPEAAAGSVDADVGQRPVGADQVAVAPSTLSKEDSTDVLAGAVVVAAPGPEPDAEAVEPEPELTEELVVEAAPEVSADEPSDPSAATIDSSEEDSQQELASESIESSGQASADTGDGVEALAEVVDEVPNPPPAVPVAATDVPPRPDAADDEHPSPGLPLPTDEQSKPETARVRERSSASRSFRRRGRRGRRRSGRRDDRETVEAPAFEPSAEQAAAKMPPAISSGEATLTGKVRISDLLSKGNEILVQIAKEPLGKKGARITSHIALPGRFLVYMPTVDHVGVSRKIASFDERSRLRTIVKQHRTGMPGGFIVRTAGDGIEEEEIRGDMLFLYNLWLDVRQKAEHRTGPGLVHQDLDIVERVLRDQLDEDFKTIWVDSDSEYERILRFVERFQSKLLSRVKLYTRLRPIFDEFGVTKGLDKALRPRVWLKSGGYIVINHTEALVAIDVNTGKYVGKSDSLEDTVVNTNLEAAQEIVRQMRLRDLGGIVVVDFIDMEDRKNRNKVIQALEVALHTDPAPSKSLPFNEFGLVVLTRKRVKQSLERTLCSPCSTCSGSGLLKSVETVIYEIMGEAREMSPDMEPQKDITLRVNPEVARTLKSRKNRYLQEIEELLKSHVLVRSDVSLQREHFDIN